MSGRDMESPMLAGVVLASELQPGVTYRIDRTLGEGGMGVAFFAIRDAPDGIAPVVVKVLRPSVMASTMGTAGKAVRKEVVALGRLNERVPQTPFVVRFIDTGSYLMPGKSMALPWIAIEYVYGGIEGTTLEQRVRYSCEHTGYAFDPIRAAHALRCLGAGLAAVHDVGVVHRDLTPGNVLCCGFGEVEIFKISDFGLARMHTLDTFGDVLLGTPGYVAPEQNFPEQHSVGPYSDVFSLACVAYHLLAGETYFDVRSVPQALVAVNAPERKSLLASRFLCPELRAQPRVCQALDDILARATAMDVTVRPAEAQRLSGALVDHLSSGGGADTARASPRLVQNVLALPSPVEVHGWSWTVRHPAGDDVALYAVAWESDGHCLAVSTAGLRYWSGTSWRAAPAEGWPSGKRLRTAHRANAGTWVLAGDETLAIYSTGGSTRVLHCPGATFQHTSGQPDDLLVAICDQPEAVPELRTFCGGRWYPTLPLAGFAVISAITRIGASRWLVAGRRPDGSAGLAVCRPLDQSVADVFVPQVRSIVACASQPEREIGLAVGTGGLALGIHPGGVTSAVLDEQPNLSTCAVDILDREWAAAAGRIWVKEPGPVSRWRSIWEGDNLPAPFVSLMADVGMVLAMTADGAVLEGRAPWSTIAPPSGSTSR